MDKMIINQLPAERLHGKRVFVRIDADAQPAASGTLVDEGKLRATLPTIEYLIGVGARLIIGTHLGTPGGKVVESLRLGPIADRLSQLLGKPVHKLNEAVGRDVAGAVTDLQDGDLLLLENLGFYAGEEANDDEFARELGQLAEVYCNDAFALATRGRASTVGITRHLRPAAAGFQMAREILMLEAVFDQPEPPFIGLIAGSRLAEKLPILENLFPKLNRLFIGGVLAFTFLKAKGQEVGAAPVDEAFLPLVKEFMFNAEGEVEIILPQDFIVVRADEMRAFEESRRQGAAPKWRRVLDTELLPPDLPVDVGPSTINRIKELFDGAHTILWNGPLGVWEIEPFGAGTREVAKLVIERVLPRSQRSLLCGDSLARHPQFWSAGGSHPSSDHWRRGGA
jgi:phosphoglycerate kinase